MKKAVGLVFVLTTSTLLAQPAPTPTPDPPTAPTVTVGVEAQLTVEEMAARIPQLGAESTEAAKLVVTLQIQARKDKDVIRLNCINDKLFQLKALRNIFDAASAEFEGATNKDDQTKAYAKVTASANTIRQLKEEALACAGEVTFKSEDTSDFTGPDIPDDPGKDWFPDPVEPPGYASPFS